MSTTWTQFPEEPPRGARSKRRKRYPPEPVRWSLDTVGAADLLGVHYQSVYAWARSGKLPCVRIGTRWRFDPDELRAWAAAGGLNGDVA